MNFRNKTIRLTAISLFLLGIGGCSVWNDFTTYFNLYYNTATLYEDAELEILSQKRDLFATEPLVIPGNAKTSLVKVVEKSSKILQFNATSSYVDEALMMLGKSFYYQGNYQKSKRKFEELLATDIDDDEIITEANLWIAKNSFELRDFTEALRRIKEVRIKAVEEDYEDVVKDSYVQEIKYRIREENYNDAISLANEFADAYDDDIVRAQIYYELGKLYTLIGENDNAILAYEKVFDNEPDFDLEIIATIKYAVALRTAGQTENALQLFEGIRTEDKFLPSYNEIDFEIGKTLVELGKYNEALDQFRLIDTTYKNTPFASASNFEMGELYRAKLLNYDSAGYYFSKAVVSNPPKEYLDKAKSNNQLFIKYSKLRGDINRFNKQFYYTENPEIFIQDSTEYLADSLKILDEFLAQKEMQEIWKGVGVDTSSSIIDSSFIKDSIFVKDSLVKVDSLIRIGEVSSFDTVGLESRLFEFRKQKRVEAENELKSKELMNLRNTGKLKTDSLNFKGNPPKKLAISIDSAKTIISKNNLELGNLFLTDLDVSDSAYSLYQENLEKYDSTIYYPNTLYAMGSYYLTIDEKTKADSLFRIIYDDYKDKSIVNAAANKLNLPLINFDYDPANELYASAETYMLDGKYSESIDRFWGIYKEYPKSPLAPKALYATAWVLEDNLFLVDSAVSVYDTLIAKYPTTPYVKNVSKKVTAYKQEKVRIQKAIDDSLSALKKIELDSTVVAVNTEEDSVDMVKQVFGGIVANTKIDEGATTNLNNEIVDPNKTAGTTPKNKLEPLWDPRRHFN
jgi:TolA-binding protein